jgi:hypothetical protein
MVLNDQDWHHIAFTWDKNDLAKDPQKDENISTKIAGITIFIDGEIQPIVSVLLNDISNFGDINNPKESLTIGRSENIEETIDKLLKEFKNDSFFEGHFKRPNTNLRLTIARQYYFNGSITEVRLWNVARTQEQIKRNMYRRLSEQDSKLSRQDQYWSKLVGYWRLEEAVDNKAYNLKSENLPYPTLSSRFNPLNFGLRLHGLVEYVDCGKLNYGKEITALTVEAWVRNMGRESDGMIVHQGGGWSEDGFSIWRCRGNLRVELQNGQNNQKIIVDTKNLVLTDSSPQWHHVAFTWKEYSEIIVYVDGKKEETTVVLSENCKSALEFSNIGIPKVNLNLGRSQNNGRYFNGCIAEVRIWNVAREEDQIQKNMDCQFNANVLKSLPELIGYWPLDQEDGDKATNPVSNDQYGTVFGRRWEKAYTLLEENKGAYGLISKSQIIKGSQYPASRLPFGLMFNEISHYIKCNFQDGENKVIDGITVEAWIKHKFGNCSIVKRSDDHQYEYSLDWYEGKIRVKLQANSEKVVVYTEECFPNDHLWHHVAFTWGKDNQAKNSHEISIYVDGRLQNCIVEGSCKTIISTMQARSIGLFEGSLKIPEKQDISLIIGCKEQGTDYYDIVIAEVRLWNVARTQDQIHKYMSRRLSRQDSEQDWSNLVGYWRLDEISEDGTLAFDQSHSHNHGTVVGATRFPALPSDAAQPPESAGFIESE